MLYIAILFSKNADFSKTLIALFGLCGPGRAAVGYLLALELVPKTNRLLIGTLANVVLSLTYLNSAFFFWFISKYTLYLLLLGTLGTFCSGIGLFFIPESPEYLYSYREFDKARASLL